MGRHNIRRMKFFDDSDFDQEVWVQEVILSMDDSNRFDRVKSHGWCEECFLLGRRVSGSDKVARNR